MDTERLSTSVRDYEGLATFLREYEKYKDPHNINQYYPDAMKGAISVFLLYIHKFAADLRFSSRLKYVQISIRTSTFDKISKELRSSLKLYSLHRITSGPSSQVCGQAVRYRRHHGAPHGLLSHQCRGDHLLHGQDCHKNIEKTDLIVQ